MVVPPPGGLPIVPRAERLEPYVILQNWDHIVQDITPVTPAIGKM
jgi:hypothetical protein